MADSHSSNGIGVGFPSLLTLVFVIFKLLGKITWSWWWVFSPLWISAGLVLAVLVIALLVAFVVALLD